MQAKKDLVVAIFDLLKSLRSQGLVYTEIRFAPQLHTQKNLTQEGAVRVCTTGLEKFYKWQDEQQDNSYPLHANLILCLMCLPNREHENSLTVRLAAKYDQYHVVEIDLAGPEGPIPNRAFSPFFKDAKALHIPFVIHAGEAAGPDSMQEALDLGTKRIGHGIRCLESNKMVKYLVDHNMTVSNTNLPKEFKLLESKTNLTEVEEHQLLLNSINAAFASDQEKNRLLAIFN